VNGVAQTLREAKNAKYDREIAWMQHTYPWVRDYCLQPPVSLWHAVHWASGATLGPARNIDDLGKIILADHQSRPLRPPAAGPAEDPHRAAILWAFGSVYRIIDVDSGYLAIPGNGASLFAPTWEELRDQMLKDLSASERAFNGRGTW
jgi:hypothetical protein